MNNTRRPRLEAIQFIRGISMLAVLGIHIGSVYSETPTASAGLVGLFVIASRFSVPIFFFISAFGIFYNMDTSSSFGYKSFLRRRLKAILIPYLVWSVFYMFQSPIMEMLTLKNFDITLLPTIPEILTALIIGTAKYHIYFLVILLWFYIFMPLWIPLIKKMTVPLLCLLFLFQTAFNYVSTGWMWSIQPENTFLNLLFNYRLNYWVVHYLFIFVLGGWLAVHYDAFKAFMNRYFVIVTAFFFIMLGIMEYDFAVLLCYGATVLEAADSIQQLSPTGICYTLASCLFFFTLFTRQPYPKVCNSVLNFLGKHSYFIYLSHPFFINIICMIYKRFNIVMTIPTVIMLYILTLTLASASAVLMLRIGSRFPIINRLTIGKG